MFIIIENGLYVSYYLCLSLLSLFCISVCLCLSVCLSVSVSLSVSLSQGVIKHKLPFGTDHDDDTLASLHVSGQYLVLGMKHGAVRLWDLSRR